MNLDIAKLAPLHIITVLEFPTDPKRADSHTQHAAIAVPDARCALQHVQRFPWRSQALQRTRLRVPTKNFLRRRGDSGLRDK